jgi:hypothetical protein
MLARMMTHRYLTDVKPLDLQQHWEKPMHAVVQFNGRQAVASIGPQRTAYIDDVIVQDASSQVIRKRGGHPPQPGILPTLSNATDDIVIFEHLQHTRDITRIVLQVGIQGDHDSPAGLFEASIQRGTLSSVVSEADGTHRELLRSELTQHLRRVIPATVIHKEELV